MELTLAGDRQTGKSYAAMKLAVDAAKRGERVLYDTDNVRAMVERFRDLQQMIPLTDCVKVLRANGNERIYLRGGGEIVMLCRARGGGRGHTADVHIIDHDRGDDAEANPTVQRVIRTKLVEAS